MFDLIIKDTQIALEQAENTFLCQVDLLNVYIMESEVDNTVTEEKKVSRITTVAKKIAAFVDAIVDKITQFIKRILHEADMKFTDMDVNSKLADVKKGLAEKRGNADAKLNVEDLKRYRETYNAYVSDSVKWAKTLANKEFKTVEDLKKYVSDMEADMERKYGGFLSKEEIDTLEMSVQKAYMYTETEIKNRVKQSKMLSEHLDGALDDIKATSKDISDKTVNKLKKNGGANDAVEVAKMETLGQMASKLANNGMKAINHSVKHPFKATFALVTTAISAKIVLKVGKKMGKWVAKDLSL